MTSLSRASTLTPCRSPTPPSIPVQPDHFYSQDNVQLPPSPHSDGKTWLDPADDPLAHRGIPVFKPTMEEFRDFEGYMNRVECWGSRSGIVKVIPPKEWTEALPPIKDQLTDVAIKTPIEQHMLGHGGRFRQENMEKRKLMSVREWVELCIKDDFRAPGIHDVGLASRGANAPTTTKPRVTRRGKQKVESAQAESSGPAIVVKEEPEDELNSISEGLPHHVPTPPNSEGSPPPVASAKKGKAKKQVKAEPKPRPKRVYQTREAREANLEDRAARDRAFLEVFDPQSEWLPPNTKASDYTPDFCRQLEREYWRNLGWGKPAWYGADTQGSLFTDATTSWNVAHLPSALSRLLPSSGQGLPGVNTPYLYFGMWRATFAWHVEDMDLFSINYIHFGAPKFWYAIPQGRATGLEQTMRSYFPKDTSQCSQFLRHKSFLASPTVLAKDACRPNCMVQQPGEFVITFPRGYHAGFNLGLNCAESVNFALESWLEVGRKAKACECVSDSVRIDVDQLIQEREEEREALALEQNPTALPARPPSSRPKKDSPKKLAVKAEAEDDGLPPVLKSASRKRKSDASDDAPKPKRVRVKTSSSSKATSSSAPAALKAIPKVSVTLKLGPRPAEPEVFPCCLCVSLSTEGLLRVQDPPISRKDVVEAASNPTIWMAHEFCASVVPETWVDNWRRPDGQMERVVFGVDGIVKDRWNLKCSSCTKIRPKSHGAPVQCTKGKCPKAFHVNCARDGNDLGIVFSIVREVEKDVIENNPSPSTTVGAPHQMQFNSNLAATDLGGVALQLRPPSESRVLKVIRKFEVQILCTQHNPAVAAQKKASKQDKIRNELMALPSMSRIKIRVSSGVFEVSLIRVIEETSSVEVLWDQGIKREFKWGSVVFGNTDGPVQQKPSDAMRGLVEPFQPSALPVTSYPSVSAATGQQTYAAPYHASSSATQSTTQANTSTSTGMGMGMTMNMSMNHLPYGASATTSYMYPRASGTFSYSQWAPYSGTTPYGAVGQTSYSNGGGYYGVAAAPVLPTATVNTTSYTNSAMPVAGPSQQQQQQPSTLTSHPQYGYHAQAYAIQPQHRGGQVHWQQSYQPSPLSWQQQAQIQNGTQMNAQGGGNSFDHRSNLQSDGGQEPRPQPQHQLTAYGHAPIAPEQLYHQGPSSTQPPHEFSNPPDLSRPSDEESAQPPSSLSANVAGSPATADAAGIVDQQRLLQDIAALGLQPAQLTELLRSNPQLRDLLWAAVGQAQITANANIPQGA